MKVTGKIYIKYKRIAKCLWIHCIVKKSTSTCHTFATGYIVSLCAVFFTTDTRSNELTYITITTLITMTKVSNIVSYKYHDNNGNDDNDDYVVDHQ